jgi:hypothetical protein
MMQEFCENYQQCKDVKQMPKERKKFGKIQMEIKKIRRFPIR